MKHLIDPKIDCVFKAVLGAEANRRLLTHFLNAVLGAALPAPIRQVEILNLKHGSGGRGRFVVGWAGREFRSGLRHGGSQAVVGCPPVRSAPPDPCGPAG